MKIESILVRPRQKVAVAVYVDEAGRKRNVSFTTEGSAAVAAILAVCQAQLPSETNHPAKAQIEQEIATVEKRVADLKRSIGQAPA